MTKGGNQFAFPSIVQQQIGLIISFNLAFGRKLNVIFFPPVFWSREIRSALALVCTPFNAVVQSQRGNENNQTQTNKLKFLIVFIIYTLIEVLINWTV